MTWAEVQRVHNCRRGVCYSLGSVRSVMCSATGSHGDRVTAGRIEYPIPRRRSYVLDRTAMIRAQKQGQRFSVFSKLRSNQYVALGPHFIVEHLTTEHHDVFVLVPDAGVAPGWEGPCEHEPATR